MRFVVVVHGQAAPSQPSGVIPNARNGNGAPTKRSRRNIRKVGGGGAQFRLYLVAVIVRDGCDAALFRKLNVKLEKPRGIKNFIEQ